MKNKKIVFLILLFLVFLLLFSNNAFASTTVYNTFPEDVLNNILTYDMPELNDSNYKLFGYYHSRVGYVFDFYYNCTSAFNIYVDKVNHWYAYDGTASVKTYIFDNSGNFKSSGTNTRTSGYMEEYHNSYLYLKNITVYVKGSSDIFFQPTSIVEEPEETIAETTLTKTVKIIPLAGVQQEIIQILPLILVVVVSLVGLRKALALLLTLLRKA